MLGNGTSLATQIGESALIEQGWVVGPMKFYFDNLAYKLWLQDIMKQFVLTVRPGTNKWYLSHWPV